MKIAVLFHRLGPYHRARLRAASALADVSAVEFSHIDHVYEWELAGKPADFPVVTLEESRDIDQVAARLLVKKMDIALGRLEPDVVAVPGWASRGALAGLYWCIVREKPAVIMSASTARDQRRQRWREGIKRLVVKSASGGLVGGTLHKQYLKSLGMAESQIFTGYDAVDNDYFKAQSDAVRESADKWRSQLDLPETFFLASSRFVEKKNLSTLLHAYAEYREHTKATAWHLVLLGDGPLREKLTESVKALGLSQWVSMPGFKQYEELPVYYGLAGAFVHPSTTEQWGLVVNEAMASGLPVLVSENCGCAPDLVQSGQNGFTFNPYDTAGIAQLLVRVASGACDRKAMGAASRRIINGWGPEGFAINLERAARAAVARFRRNRNIFYRAFLWSLMRL